MTDVHSVDAASTTVDCRIHFFDKNLVKKWTSGHPLKVGAVRIHYSEKSGCSIHIFNLDVHDIHPVDAAPTPGLTDVIPVVILFIVPHKGQTVSTTLSTFSADK